MNLKESYRYANFLDNLLNTAYLYVANKGFVTTTKQEHLRSKTNPEATDETIEVQKPYDVEFKPNDVIDFAVKVLSEKESLADAIAIAKANTEINIDNAVAMNKKKQKFVTVLNSIVGIKPSEKQVTETGYKFNQEGNQVKYFYNVKQITSIDFDRNNIRNLIKKYAKETDDISTKLDLIEVTTNVEYEPLFDINDNFDECILKNK